MEQVILVDQYDNAIGTMEKLDAHKKGVLHRAFSVFVFNSKGELLIQKRAQIKYHSPGLWTNTCCSHPLPGEKIENASRRRLNEEMGIETELRFAYKFIYKAELEKNLVEHEYDHVFFGRYDKMPKPNTSEVEAWKYVDVTWLKKDIENNPDLYTYWFKLILNNPQFKI